MAHSNRMAVATTTSVVAPTPVMATGGSVASHRRSWPWRINVAYGGKLAATWRQRDVFVA